MNLNTEPAELLHIIGHYSSISASPTACLLRGYGRAGTQTDRLSEAVILSTGTPIPAQWACRRRCLDRANPIVRRRRGSHTCARPWRGHPANSYIGHRRRRVDAGHRRAGYYYNSYYHNNYYVAITNMPGIDAPGTIIIVIIIITIMLP